MYRDRERGHGPVGIGNRRVDAPTLVSPADPDTQATRTLRTFMMLGQMYQEDLAEGELGIVLSMDQRSMLRAAIAEADKLEHHTVIDFHLGLPLEEQDEIKAANGNGLIGVHMAGYALLRQGGIEHPTALLLSRLAAGMQYHESPSEPGSSA